MKVLIFLTLFLPSVIRLIGFPRGVANGTAITLLVLTFILWVVVGRRLSSVIEAQKAQYVHTPSNNVNENIINYQKLQKLKQSERKWWQWWLQD